MAITLARRFAKIAWFVLLFCLGTRLIDPASFISLETTQRFAVWLHGYSSQENFDDLWVLTWLVCSLVFASISYIVTIKIIRKVRH